MKAILFALFISVSISAQTLSPKVLVGLESRIAMQKMDLSEVESKLRITDDTEGKIVATLINTINDRLKLAEKLISQIDSDEALNEKNINKINKILDEVDSLIKSI